MRSPFPGMAPFIEAGGPWQDFYYSLTNRIAVRLAEAVPERYVVRNGVRSNLSPRECCVEVYDFEPKQRLVTCVEVLSPANKQYGSESRELYLRKRQGLLQGSTVSLVEIDLLRGGTRMPMLDPWPDSPYAILVATAPHGPRCRVWPAHFRREVPSIPVPLHHGDEPVTVSLQPMIEWIYQTFRYSRTIKYARPLTPPLSAEDSAWLDARLRGWTKDGGEA